MGSQKDRELIANGQKKDSKRIEMDRESPFSIRFLSFCVSHHFPNLIRFPAQGIIHSFQGLILHNRCRLGLLFILYKRTKSGTQVGQLGHGKKDVLGFLKSSQN